MYHGGRGGGGGGVAPTASMYAESDNNLGTMSCLYYGMSIPNLHDLVFTCMCVI